MKFASLGSGSSGNATLIQNGDTLIMLDCGFAIKEVERRIAKLGCSADQINAILVTHEHTDHAKGVAPLARKYKIPVYMTEGTWACKDYGKLPELNVIRNYQSFQIDDILIEPIVVPHDAREPAQFVLSNAQGVRLGVLTDLGSVTPHIEKAYQNCDGLLVEANHDLEMLANGPYPPSLKSRVASHWGHLNNLQTAQLLEHFPIESLQHIVVGHISQKNNSLDCVKSALEEIIPRAKSIHFACQDEGFDWLALYPAQENALQKAEAVEI